MKKYTLSFDTRYLIEKDSIVLRRGVWNTLDGRIDISNLENADNFIKVLQKLTSEELADEEIRQFLTLNDYSVFTNIIKEGFVSEIQCGVETSLKVLSGMDICSSEQVVFSLITDSDLISNTVQQFSNTYGYVCDIKSRSLIEKMSDINYFDKVNPLEYQKQKNAILEEFKQEPILVILSCANIPLLRNLNEIASPERPLFIGLIDGPFMIFLSLIPDVTACWECFETRMLSNLRDHILYNKFTNCSLSHQTSSACNNLHLTHLLHMGLQEVISYSQVKMSKFLGRVVYIYLPTFEVHVHKLLRISSCGHCGYLEEKSSKIGNKNLSNIVSNYFKF